MRNKIFILDKTNFIFLQDSNHDPNSCNDSGNETRTCNTLSTGAILLADILPSVFIKLVAPFLSFFIQ